MSGRAAFMNQPAMLFHKMFLGISARLVSRIVEEVHDSPLSIGDC